MAIPHPARFLSHAKKGLHKLRRIDCSRTLQTLLLLRALGFTRVAEVVFGADLVSEAYRAHIAQRDDPVITTPCPAIIEYIEKYQPELIPSLAPIVSPMIAAGKVMREKYGSDAMVAFIGPSVTEKLEILDENVAGVIVVEGRQRCLNMINEIAQGKVRGKRIDILFCEGCINGPGMSSPLNYYEKRESIITWVKARHRRLDQADWHDSLEAYRHLDLARTFADRHIVERVPEEREIRHILHTMGKHGPEDEINCAACGYESCRALAIAAAQDKTRHGIERVSHEWEMRPNLELVVNMKTAPVKAPAGDIIGFVTTIQDVTQLKRLDAQKSQFVSMVAHELKAPVAAVSGYLETMNSRILGDDIAKYEKMISRSGERLQALIDLVNDLLSISRRELGTVRREIAPVPVAEVIENTRELLLGEMEKRGITWHAVYEDRLPAIDIDRDEFSRVITNLLSNAIKYNRVNGSIDVRARKEDGTVHISIADRGIGMKAEDRELLFRQFYRIKNDETRSIPGTGLGLSIVRQIIESYHGSIGVESTWGEGSVFTLRLPIRFSGEE